MDYGRRSASPWTAVAPSIAVVTWIAKSCSILRMCHRGTLWLSTIHPGKVPIQGEEMTERTGIIHAGGNPLTLIGHEVKVGDTAPDFEVIDNNMNPVTLSSFRGKVVIISAVPSLETRTCDMETRRFNQEAGNLSQDIVILTISMDLPFAQKRWCGATGVDKVITLSDHRDALFGTAYGVLIKEMRLLARTVFVIDRQGTVRYIQVVKDITTEPDYDPVIAAANELL
jgi:thiol peroxidase